MRESVVSCAMPIADEPAGEGILRVVNHPIPDFTGKEQSWRSQYEQFYDLQATKVIDILTLLPGGTLDRVLLKLMHKALSLHKISWEPQGEK